MAPKQIALRVEQEVAEQLKLRASIERRSVNEIINAAIREYATAHPVSREQMLALVRTIAKEDAGLLKALADA
jgi:hypothetical protein